LLKAGLCLAGSGRRRVTRRAKEHTAKLGPRGLAQDQANAQTRKASPFVSMTDLASR